MIVRDGDMIEMGSKMIRHEHGVQLCPMRVCVMLPLLFIHLALFSLFLPHNIMLFHFLIFYALTTPTPPLSY